MTKREVQEGTSQWLIDPRRPRFALQMAILSYVVVVHSDPIRAAVGALVAAVGLFTGDLIVRTWFWVVVGALTTVWFWVDWPLLDNHVALSVYWGLAIAVALGKDDWVETLAESARWTIVAVFTLAVFWKLASPDFLDFRFFEWTLLVDPRFEPVARTLGMSSESLIANRELVGAGMDGVINSNSGVAAMARALTVGTLVLESAVALSWALGNRLGRLRHWLLATFGFVTYVMVPVAGFGFMLLVIAIATVDTRIARLSYAFGAFGLLAYALVWNSVVL
jgi:hypothetical protein